MTLHAAKDSIVAIKCPEKTLTYHCTGSGVGNFNPKGCGNESTIKEVWQVVELY